MSSLKIAPGWRVTIYRDDDFNGESFDATSRFVKPGARARLL
jgi:hypothetical protein